MGVRGTGRLYDGVEPLGVMSLSGLFELDVGRVGLAGSQCYGFPCVPYAQTSIDKIRPLQYSAECHALAMTNHARSLAMPPGGSVLYAFLALLTCVW